MSDVVGTAYVRIKALTNNLAKDIEASVKKGLKDANLEKAAASSGSDSGKAFGDEFVDASDKTIGRRAKKNNPIASLLGNFDDVLDDVRKNFDKLNTPFSNFRANVNDSDDDTQGWLKRLRASFKGLGNDMDASVGKSLDRLSAKFKSLGSSGSFNIGLLKGTLLLIGGAILAALPYIQDVGSAVLAYATGLVAQVGALTTAVGGLGIAAGAAIGSAAVSFIPILLAFKAETEILESFKESLKDTGQEFLAIGSATQQTLLPALDEALLIVEGLIPMFSEFGLFVGKTVGQFSIFASETLISAEAQGRFQAILQSSLRILDQLLPILLNVGDLLSGLWVAAIPVSERFVATIGRLIERWRDLVTEGLRTGTLTETLDEWYSRAELITGALGNVAGALFDILQVGADSADGLFVRFDQWAERYRAFTESEAGQNRLKLIFDNSLAVMREINGVVADLFDGIFGRLGEVGGVDSMVAALQRFREILPDLQEKFQDFLGAIERVNQIIASNIWERFTQTVEELGEPLGRLGNQLLEFLQVMNDSGAFEVFLDLMRILTDTLAVLLSIPGFGQFVAYMIAFGTAAKVAAIALGPFIKLFGSFAGILTTMVRAQMGLKVAGLAGSLMRLAAGFKAVSAAGSASTLAQAFKVGAGPAGSFAGGIGGVVSKLGLLGPAGIAAGIGVAAVGTAFFIHRRNAQKWQQEIRQVTSALGELNGGLNILNSEGIADYIRETSRFDSRNQEDDLKRMGLTAETLGKQFAEGTISIREFADEALRAREISITAVSDTDQSSNGDTVRVRSLEALQRQFKLTDEEIDNLVDGLSVYRDGVTLSISDNEDLLVSFEEMQRAAGAAAKKSIDAFASNSQNIRLLGSEALSKIQEDIEDASDADAANIMRDALVRLGVAAADDTAEIKGLSDATIQQAKAQLQGTTATERAIELNRILTEESRKQSRQIRADLDLFRSDEFAAEFGEARQAVFDFSDAMTAVSDFGLVFDDTSGLDAMLNSIGPVADATYDLFGALQSLPEAEFNAAATSLGVDAGVLRDAMNGAQQAIIDLGEQALSTLPSVGQLLDEATSVQEDGSRIFDKEGFVKSVQDRTQTTLRFKDNIARIQRDIGDEAARIAVAQGPEAAENLVSMIGVNEDQLNASLEAMQKAEDDLKRQIAESLGPGIAAEYAVQAGIIGDGFTTTLSNSLSSDATLAAINRSGQEAMNEIAAAFQGYFVFDSEGNAIKFVNTGLKRTFKPVARRGGGFFLSDGGFVGDSFFGRGPRGTDTVPAFLTPGEFVLRRAVAQSIPASVLNSLNAGDPRMISLLSALSKTRPGTAPGVVASTSPSGQPAKPGGNVIIQQMNIEAPSPLETSRQVGERLRIIQTQLVSR